MIIFNFQVISTPIPSLPNGPLFISRSWYVLWALSSVFEVNFIDSIGYFFNFRLLSAKTSNFCFWDVFAIKKIISNLKLLTINGRHRTSIKKRPSVNPTVVITWIKMEELHGCYLNPVTNDTLFPSGYSKKLSIPVKEVKEEKYWPGWVDTEYQASKSCSFS